MATADNMARSAGVKRTEKKAAQKKTAMSRKTTISADRVSNLKRTQVRSDKTTSTMRDRAKQNAGTADGTIRLGAKGKSYNVFDAKTQRWMKGQVVVGNGRKSAGTNAAAARGRAAAARGLKSAGTNAAAARGRAATNRKTTPKKYGYM